MPDHILHYVATLISPGAADTHTGEFAGIPATGRMVRVPRDLRGNQISALRIYFPMSLLTDQLTI